MTTVQTIFLSYLLKSSFGKGDTFCYFLPFFWSTKVEEVVGQGKRHILSNYVGEWITLLFLEVYFILLIITDKLNLGSDICFNYEDHNHSKKYHPKSAEASGRCHTATNRQIGILKETDIPCHSPKIPHLYFCHLQEFHN